MESCFYTSCNPIIVGCKLYQDNLATIPVIDGYYSNGTNCFQVGGGNGTVIAINACIPPDSHILSSNVWIFNIARSSYSDAKTSSTSDTVINSGTQNVGNALDTQNEIGRLLAVFDTTSVTYMPTSGTVSFFVPTNAVSTPLTFNNIKPNVTFLPLQVMNTGNWDEWNGSTDNTGVSESSLTIAAFETGKRTFTLSSSQLSDIFTNNQFSYFLISNGDKGAVPPSTNSRPLFSSESGLGLSGVGDYELVLHYS